MANIRKTQMRSGLVALLFASVGLSADCNPANLDDVVLFTNGSSLVTLTNNHQLLPSACQYKGRVSANRSEGGRAPLDSIVAMAWYIETSRKLRANYLLANAHYESLWAYQCTQTEAPSSQTIN